MLMTPLRMVFRVEIRYISGFRPVMDGDATLHRHAPFFPLHGPVPHLSKLGDAAFDRLRCWERPVGARHKSGERAIAS